MQLYLEDGSYIITNEGIDCSIALSASAENPTAWYVDAPKMEPVRANGWIGAVAEGGSVNFRDIAFNPHGHCTHTECLGHITPTVYSVNRIAQKLLVKAYVISVYPEQIVAPDGSVDHVINAQAFQGMLDDVEAEALLIRTLPNSDSKRTQHYSATNPAYCSVDILPIINQMGVKHLLVDVPSVDRELDNGVLAFHHAFWNVPHDPNHEKTITELIYIPNDVEDGNYLLNLQTAAFENDATPSRPVLYPIHRNAEEQ
jgi:arylformamidase